MTLDRYRRPGISAVELLVSFTLLTAVLGTSLPLMVRHGRILSSARQYRMALDELSDQAEAIALLEPDEARGAIEQLKPSTFAEKHLRGIQLTGTLSSQESAERVTLSLVWDEPGRRAAPVSLVVWLRSANADAERLAPEEGR